ncbi:MAG: hypothetical protein WAM14_20850 [Candidatus Nitrosopolaris sp.]
MKFIYTGYYTSGALVPKVPRKRFVNAASDEEKKQFKKDVFSDITFGLRKDSEFIIKTR